MRTFKTFLEVDDISQVQNHHKLGKSVEDISKLTRIHPDKVKRIISRIKNKPDISKPVSSKPSIPPVPKTVTISDDEAKQIFDMRKKGRSEQRISEKMGYHQSIVKKHIDDNEDRVKKYKDMGIYHPPLKATKRFTPDQMALVYKLRKTHLETHIAKRLKKQPRALAFLDSDENKKRPDYVPPKHPKTISDEDITHAYSLRKEKKYSRNQITDMMSVRLKNDISKARLHRILDSDENKKRPDYVPHYNIEVKYLGRGKWGRKNPEQ